LLFCGLRLPGRAKQESTANEHKKTETASEARMEPPEGGQGNNRQGNVGQGNEESLSSYSSANHSPAKCSCDDSLEGITTGTTKKASPQSLCSPSSVAAMGF
jgi:hypothetical protein